MRPAPALSRPRQRPRLSSWIWFPEVIGKGYDSRFFFSSRRRHTIWTGDWSSDVCSSDLDLVRSQRTERPVDGMAQGRRSHAPALCARSEERRVGKECRWRRREGVIERSIPRANEGPRPNAILPHYFLSIGLPHHDVSREN